MLTSTGDSPCQTEQQCATPTGYRRTTYTTTDKAVLTVNYEWQSSSGDLGDLRNCKIREHVTYPGAPQGDFTWPPPFDLIVENPTIVEKSAVDGALSDTHAYIFDENATLEAASVSAVQYYQFSCPCHADGEWTNLDGPHSIERTIEPNSNNGWKYTITKHRKRAVLDPLR